MIHVREVIDVLLKETEIEDSSWLLLIALLEDTEELILKAEMSCSRGFFAVHLSTPDYNDQVEPPTGYYIGILPPKQDFGFHTAGFPDLPLECREEDYDSAVSFLRNLLSTVFESTSCHKA